MGYDLERKPFATKLKKLLRFSDIYGTKRALVKAAGRLQQAAFRHIVLGIFFPKKRFVSVIGCGQFSFSTICYFLYKRHGNHFLESFDIDPKKQETLSKFYNFKGKAKSAQSLLENPDLKIVYIVSNHASHTQYAIDALKRNVDIYLEKPISINWEQFELLKKAITESKSKIYAGYNRPYAAATQKVVAHIKDAKKPITLNCFISGHLLETDHWYRKPDEGSRICGNVGHWLDLMVHLMNQRGHVPQNYKVHVAYSDMNEPDDNITVTITTEYNDLTSITITSRTEPFEGINETLNLQCGNVIAKIDDFRKLTIWQNEKHIEEHYHHKDVGHKLSVNQPFLPADKIRDWKEVEFSTSLMLHISDMVKNKAHISDFQLNFSR